MAADSGGATGSFQDAASGPGFADNRLDIAVDVEALSFGVNPQHDLDFIKAMIFLKMAGHRIHFFAGDLRHVSSLVMPLNEIVVPRALDDLHADQKVRDFVQQNFVEVHRRADWQTVTGKTKLDIVLTDEIVINQVLWCDTIIALDTERAIYPEFIAGVLKKSLESGTPGDALYLLQLAAGKKSVAPTNDVKPGSPAPKPPGE